MCWLKIWYKINIEIKSDLPNPSKDKDNEKNTDPSPTKLGLISSNPFLLDSKNFENKKFYINITIGNDCAIDELKISIENFYLCRLVDFPESIWNFSLRVTKSQIYNKFRRFEVLMFYRYQVVDFPRI